MSDFNRGDLVIVSETVRRLDLRGRTGTVAAIYDLNPSSILYGVEVDGWYNPSSKRGLFWFGPDELYKDQNYVAIKDVIFNDPATIVMWSDGSKTIVKCSDNDIFDKEKGLAMVISKKMLGDSFHKTFKELTADA